MKCQLRLCAIVIAAFGFGLPSLAIANPVTLISDDRGGYSVGQPCWEDYETYEYTCGPSYNNSYSPPSDFADWNGGGQNTKVAPLEMSGTGSGSAYSDYGWSEANTTFDITFDVVSAVTMVLTGNLWSSSYWGGGEAGMWLEKDGVQILSAVAYDDDIDLIFNEILLPAQYRLKFYTAANPISDAGFSFDVEITPVPEPSTALLVGFGLLLVGRASRR
jgi:hypothetical protein